MALFTDAAMSTIDELHGLDTQLLDVASVEGIDVTRKLSVAQAEIGVELAAVLQRMSVQPFETVWTGAQNWLGRVVVTPPLKIWHMYRTLEAVYRDAYHSQLNDRYGARRDEYHDLAKWAWEKVLESGIGMTADPVAQAGQPAVQEVAGALADGTYYIGMSWTNAGGEEGACSLPVAVTVAGGTFQVTPGAAPSNASGWNVYAGVSPAAMLRQNGAVLGLSATWTQPNAVANGKAAGTGQAPGWVQPVTRLFDRG